MGTNLENALADLRKYNRKSAGVVALVPNDGVGTFWEVLDILQLKSNSYSKSVVASGKTPEEALRAMVEKLDPATPWAPPAFPWAPPAFLKPGWIAADSVDGGPLLWWWHDTEPHYSTEKRRGLEWRFWWSTGVIIDLALVNWTPPNITDPAKSKIRIG